MSSYYDNESQAEYLLFTPPAALHTCVFCGNNEGTFDFKGKVVCEDCLDYVKDLY